MRIKCWVVWWDGKDPEPCRHNGMLAIGQNEEDAGDHLACNYDGDDPRYTVRPAVLEVEE